MTTRKLVAALNRKAGCAKRKVKITQLSKAVKDHIQKPLTDT